MEGRKEGRNKEKHGMKEGLYTTWLSTMWRFSKALRIYLLLLYGAKARTQKQSVVFFVLEEGHDYTKSYPKLLRIGLLACSLSELHPTNFYSFVFASYMSTLWASYYEG